MKSSFLIRRLIGLAFVFLISFFIFLDEESAHKWDRGIDHGFYDFLVQKYHRSLDRSNVMIIDIDDNSIGAIGAWPWPRNILSDMLAKLSASGASAVGFDIIFSTPEKNLVGIVNQTLSKDAPQLADQLAQYQENFEFDQQFATSLQKIPSVLAFEFSDVYPLSSVGPLPPALFQVDETIAKLGIPIEKNYLNNIELFTKSAKNGGFLNLTPDEDGVIRRSQFLYRYQDQIYPSVALAAALTLIGPKKVELLTRVSLNQLILTGVKIDQTVIHTDEKGKVLIPFRGPAYTFPYYSALDLLDGSVPKKDIENKLVFIGSTAVGMGNFRATAIDPIFPGVAIHASTAQGIIDQYFPSQSVWHHEVVLGLTLVLGILFAWFSPRLNALWMLSCTLVALIAIVTFTIWMYVHHQVYILIFFPLFIIVVLFLFNLIYGYFTEMQTRNELQTSFGQYVSPEYIDVILAHPDISMEGENKELTVLFADIRNFTHISEQFKAPDLKHFLNSYFSPMTDLILKNHGTIDKYVGDMIMAFWAAPVDNPRHAYDAIHTATQMIALLTVLNEQNRQQNLPEIYMRIGINSGAMNVGDMGSSFRKSYTVLGDAVNLASRLEGLGKIYFLDILVGEPTYLATKDDFLFRKIDKVQVKGREKITNIYHPICPLQEATQMQRQLADRHLQALEFYQNQHWDEAEKLFFALKAEDPPFAELYQVFLDRIQAYRKSPPPAPWEAIFKIDNK